MLWRRHEARLSGGAVLFDPIEGEAPCCIGLWLLHDTRGAAIANAALSGPRIGNHAP